MLLIRDNCQENGGEFSGGTVDQIGRNLVVLSNSLLKHSLQSAATSPATFSGAGGGIAWTFGVDIATKRYHQYVDPSAEFFLQNSADFLRLIFQLAIFFRLNFG